MKASPAILINKKCHSQRFLASKCEWGLPKLWSSSCCFPPQWLLRNWGMQEARWTRTGLVTDSWGAYERNEFSKPRGLHLPILIVVQSFSRVWLFATPWTAARQASCPSSSPRACSNSCSLSWWFYPTISSSVVPFSSRLQSFPTSGSFQMSQFFPSGGQSVEISASASVFPLNIQDWFPLGLTGLISLQSTGFSRLFSNSTAQKHQFFSAQPSLWSNSHIHTWLLEKPQLWLYRPLSAKQCVCFLICCLGWS